MEDPYKMETHRESVSSLSHTITHFHQAQQPFRIYHGTTNSTRPTTLQRSSIVDLSALTNILSISHTTHTAVIEPNVPMDVLVDATLQHNLLPPVVMEFPGITAGGGFVGTAGESSSFKHGFFDRSVVRAEVILADGNVVNASATENAELFEGLSGSFGTLGVLTLLEVRLVEVGTHVEVSYYPVSGMEDAKSRIEEEMGKKEVEYIDGILFSPSSGVIITAEHSTYSPSYNPSNLPIQKFSRPWDEWFYLHAQSICSSSPRNTPIIELVLIKDYLFRYNRGAFWTGLHAFRSFHVPFTRLTRLLLDYFMHTRIMYHALHASGHTARYIIQDIAVPAFNAVPFANWIDAELGIWPLWICPLRGDARVSMGYARDTSNADKPAAGKDKEYYISLGIWGPPPGQWSHDSYIAYNRALEHKTKLLGGLKWLYARVFYTPDEWNEIYDAPRYNAVRERWGAVGLPSIWDKIGERKAASSGEEGGGSRAKIRMWLRSNPGFLSGVYGVWKALKGGEYLLSSPSPSSMRGNAKEGGHGKTD